MTKLECAQLADRLAVLAEILGESLSPTRIAGYMAALNDLEYADLVDALDDCARTAQWFPKPVEIRLRVGRIVDRREAIALAEQFANRDADSEPLLLPETTRPSVESPEETPEERAEREARIRRLWDELFAKARSLSQPIKPMPEARAETPQTIAQIRQWRKGRIA